MDAIEAAARYEWMCGVLAGEGTSDFALSFPEIRQLADLFDEAERLRNQKQIDRDDCQTCLQTHLDALKLANHQRDTEAYSNKGNAERFQALINSFAKQETAFMANMQRMRDDFEYEIVGLKTERQRWFGKAEQRQIEINRLQEVLSNIAKVASGEDQVADDDTGGLAWIQQYIAESV